MDAESFVNVLSEGNESRFKEVYMKLQTCILREKVYTFILSRESEDDFLDVTHDDKECVAIVCRNLAAAGWATQFSFGDTGLFIYREKNGVPRTCWG